MKGDIVAFNYRTIYVTEEERLKTHNDFVVNHYLKQFNEETIKTKQQRTCGELFGAVCKKCTANTKKIMSHTKPWAHSAVFLTSVPLKS